MLCITASLSLSSPGDAFQHQHKTSLHTFVLELQSWPRRGKCCPMVWTQEERDCPGNDFPPRPPGKAGLRQQASGKPALVAAGHAELVAVGLVWRKMTCEQGLRACLIWGRDDREGI